MPGVSSVGTAFKAFMGSISHERKAIINFNKLGLFLCLAHSVKTAKSLHAPTQSANSLILEKCNLKPKRLCSQTLPRLCIKASKHNEQKQMPLTS